MARFYVDEDLGLDVVSLLRGREHDVEYALEVGHEQQPDAFHLKTRGS